MSDIQIFIRDKDNEGEWRDIDEGLLDLSSHDAKVRADGYNKAIDDFVNACKENIMYKTFGLRECDIEKIAERLKEAEMNNEKIMCKDCEHFRIEKPDECNEGHAYCLKYDLSTTLIGKQYKRKIDRLECYKCEIEIAERLKAGVKYEM